jgi:DNA (cytosine-5)-methyltransferase 1
MKILNLYAGIGGNRKLWGNNHNITAVEINPDIAKIYQDFFPNDKVIIADAHEYLLEHFKEFDFIWSSPPCQSHSRMVKATKHDIRVYPDMSLYQEIILLKELFKGKWIVENVKAYYNPLIKPKEIGRHWIWCNFDITYKDFSTPSGFIDKDNVKGAEELKKWLGLEYEGNIYYKNNHCPAQVLRNCVHPKLGLHIFNEAFNIKDTTFKQQSLL